MHAYIHMHHSYTNEYPVTCTPLRTFMHPLIRTTAKLTHSPIDIHTHIHAYLYVNTHEMPPFCLYAFAQLQTNTCMCPFIFMDVWDDHLRRTCPILPMLASLLWSNTRFLYWNSMTINFILNVLLDTQPQGTGLYSKQQPQKHLRMQGTQFRISAPLLGKAKRMEDLRLAQVSTCFPKVKVPEHVPKATSHKAEVL